ncbi:MAG: hypothetical protein JNJ60_04575 [Rhodocyclaceae bacterium]|nr:hypothetical protein [Rhodocyclaceae bacterium]
MPAGPFYGTFIEYWPASVAALSMPQVGTVLGDADAELIASCVELGGVCPSRFSAALTSWLHRVTQAWSQGVFLRLGGRSFVLPARPPVPVTTAGQALQVLAFPGERAARMARRCVLAGRPLWLFARHWRSITPEEEFRLVVRNRQITAASQIHHRLCFPGLAGRADAVARRIVRFGARLGPVLHLDDVIADVWVPFDDTAGVELIELNPLMSVTGRALLEGAVTGAHPRALHFRQPHGPIGIVPLPPS